MYVSNTVLILAVQLLNMNQLLCPEWVSDTAPLSAQYVNENHVLSDSSLCAVGFWSINESQSEHESRPHRSLSSGEWVPVHTLAASFAEESWMSRGSSTPGQHARGWPTHPKHMMRRALCLSDKSLYLLRSCSYLGKSHSGLRCGGGSMLGVEPRKSAGLSLTRSRMEGEGVVARAQE